MTESLPLLVSIAESCVLLGIGRTKVYELVAAGELKTRLIGRRRMVPRAELERFIKRDHPLVSHPDEQPAV